MNVEFVNTGKDFMRELYLTNMDYVECCQRDFAAMRSLEMTHREIDSLGYFPYPARTIANGRRGKFVRMLMANEIA